MKCKGISRTEYMQEIAGHATAWLVVVSLVVVSLVTMYLTIGCADQSSYVKTERVCYVYSG